MTFDETMSALMAQGTDKNKHIYQKHGACEPLFGVSIAALKLLARKIKKDHALAEQLYATGNYDAMYLAGMVADPAAMTEADFERWLEGAYFHALSNDTVAGLLAESSLAESIADRWLQSTEELRLSAGWTCYNWLICIRPDSNLDRDKLLSMVQLVEKTVHTQPNYTRYAMNNFLIALGISYLPLHKEAVQAAAKVGRVNVHHGKTNCKTPLATEYIEKAVDQGRLGYKRKGARC